MTAQAQADIDAGALRHNLKRVRELAPGSQVMAVVKANAYGHGIVPVARALSDDVDALAVARMTEAAAIRDAHCPNRIVLLEGVMLASELDLAARHELDLVVHREDQIDMLEAYVGGGRFDVWLKVDTGMNRLGFLPEEALDAHARLEKIECVNSPCRLMTHLACADEPSSPATDRQIAAFDELFANTAGEQTITNSAGLIGWPHAQRDWVRPGLMLYGASPLPGRSVSDLGLRPVMTLWSRVIAVKPLHAGGRVGYGGDYTAPADTHMGIIAAGYGDGYPWKLASGTPVLVNEALVPLIGRVSMDMIAVDLGPETSVQPGDRAVLWGEGLDVNEVASRSGTIPWELLCGISQRVRVDLRS